jgi:hypothetical protein
MDIFLPGLILISTSHLGSSRAETAASHKAINDPELLGVYSCTTSSVFKYYLSRPSPFVTYPQSLVIPVPLIDMKIAALIAVIVTSIVAVEATSGYAANNLAARHSRLASRDATVNEPKLRRKRCAEARSVSFSTT